jgi:hypothetical protein
MPVQAQQINNLAIATQQNDGRTNFIPQLSTGSFPKSQASAISNINDSNSEPKQAIPNPPNATSSGALPPQIRIQNTRGNRITSVPPWISVKNCGKTMPKSRGLGLTPSGAINLNLPGKQAQPIIPQFGWIHNPSQLVGGS